VLLRRLDAVCRGDQLRAAVEARGVGKVDALAEYALIQRGENASREQAGCQKQRRENM